jgi:hypothetical protein
MLGNEQKNSAQNKGKHIHHVRAGVLYTEYYQLMFARMKEKKTTTST